MTTITQAIAAIRARADAATAGPWEVDPDLLCDVVNTDHNPKSLVSCEYNHDAPFIASARRDLPMLLDYADALLKAGNELIQSRLHQDICIAEYKCDGSHENARRVSESSCRVAEAIESWEKASQSILSREEK